MNIRIRPDAFEYDRPIVDVEWFRKGIANRLLYTIGRHPDNASERDVVEALCYVVRDLLIERWVRTIRTQYDADAKRVYYLSMEFLVGRALLNSVLSLDIHEPLAQACQELGIDLDVAAAFERDPGLGNGGLGRLAACFLDSMARLSLPGFGYGIRYDHGMFVQDIVDGRQVERPDDWLAGGHPWEFPRPDIAHPVGFGGHTVHDGGRVTWHPSEEVRAMAHDMIVPGYETESVCTLRLWSARSVNDLSLTEFNQGNHVAALDDRARSESVSRVLYPDDSTPAGRELRLRQEHFFVSAAVQDILRRYRKIPRSFDALADKVAIHLNDTHPALAVAELMRLLVDEHGVPWPRAWATCCRVFSYTNHTLMPEALETWPFEVLEALLPRHLEIILEINERFLAWVREHHGDEPDLPRRVSLIDESGERRVRMAYLAILASHKVNGVSELHSRLMVETIFADWARLFPDRFCNKTNGITPRRWLALANPPLSACIDSRIGRNWRADLEQLGALRPAADDAAFRDGVRRAKHGNKVQLAGLIAERTGIIVDPAALFDVQIKRLHEYKRQLLNLLHVVTRYQRILDAPDEDHVPRVVILAGKAASAYHMAKLIIHLANDIAAVVNAEPAMRGRLKVAFVPNYNVSLAEAIIPAADLSQQISTAGTEASGTGNMKLALNGALTIGTEDGANIEIRDRVGTDNIFIFGRTAEEVQALRAGGYQPRIWYEQNPELNRVLNLIAGGHFSPDEPTRYHPIVNALLGQDPYLLLADYADYVRAQARVDALYRDPDRWACKSVLNIAAMGPFSSDRTVGEYARDIWGIRPLTVPGN